MVNFTNSGHSTTKYDKGSAESDLFSILDVNAEHCVLSSEHKSENLTNTQRDNKSFYTRNVASRFQNTFKSKIEAVYKKYSVDILK